MTAVHVVIQGRVQGVGFRFFAQETAVAHGLKGWVRNRPGGEVEAEAEGELAAIEKWLEDLRKGPPLARVDSLQVDWRPVIQPSPNFEIR